MDITEAFKRVGHFGIFQKFTILFLALVSVYQGMQTATSNFISGQPERWCRITNLTHLSFEQQKDIAIPQDSEGEYDSCRMFDLDWESYSVEDFVNWNRSAIEDNTDTVPIPCDEFIYSKEQFLETANSKWNLVCSNSLLGEMMSTSYVGGLFLGSLSSGISDVLGRRTAAFGFLVMLMGTLFAAAFVNNPIAFLVLRFLVGYSARGASMSSSVLMLEISGPKQREMAGVLLPGGFSIGVLVSSGIAYALREFQTMHKVMGGMTAALFLAIIVVPESPRWLLVNGKVEKAEKTMRLISEVNGRPLPDDFTFKQKESTTQKKKEQISYSDLYRYPVLRKHVIVAHFLWVATNFSYIAMTLTLGALTGDAYLNVSLSGITELPTCIAVLFLMRCIGRTKAFIVFGILFVIFNGLAVPFELIADLRIVASIFTILARACASALICVCQVYTAELFPTSCRQRVLGAMSGFAAGVSISGPYLTGSLREVWRPLSNILFGSLGVLAVIATLFMPDTLGLGIPDSVEAAIAIAHKGKPREQKMDSIPSVSMSADKTANGINGVHNPGFTNGEAATEPDEDFDIAIFHF